MRGSLCELNNGKGLVFYHGTPYIKAALYAITDMFENDGVQQIPIFLSGTIVDKSGRTLSG